MNVKINSNTNENFLKNSKGAEKSKVANSADISRLKESTNYFSNVNKYDSVLAKQNQDQNNYSSITANKPFGTEDSNMFASYKISNKNLKNSIENLKVLSKHSVKRIHNQMPVHFGKHGRTMSEHFEQTSKLPMNFNLFEKNFLGKLQSTGTSKFYSQKKDNNDDGRLRPTILPEKIEKNPTMSININLNMNVNHNITNIKDQGHILPNLNYAEFSKEKNKTKEIYKLLKSINHIKQNNNPQVLVSNNHFLGNNQNNINGSNFKLEKLEKRADSKSTTNSSRKYAQSKEKNSISSNFKVTRFSPIKFSNKLNEEQDSLNKGKNINKALENQDELFTRLTTSYIKKVVSKSKPGVNYEGISKTNQDSYLVKQNIFSLPNFSIFGVFDGHGLYGHYVSNKIKLFFSEFFSQPETYGCKDNYSRNYTTNNYIFNNAKATDAAPIKELVNISEEIIYEKLTEKNYELLKHSFHLAESSLLQCNFEVNFSGTTSVLVFNIGNKIICANAGDSRAILVTESENHKDTRIIPLSRDHKPDLTDETNRILKSGGRVDRYLDDGVRSGPFRVWLRNETYPGLAMSRSIGDLVAGTVGVICEPGI